MDAEQDLVDMINKAYTPNLHLDIKIESSDTEINEAFGDCNEENSVEKESYLDVKHNIIEVKYSYEEKEQNINQREEKERDFNENEYIVYESIKIETELDNLDNFDDEANVTIFLQNDKNSEIYQCNRCSCQFGHKDALVKHLKVIHGTGNKFICNNNLNGRENENDIIMEAVETESLVNVQTKDVSHVESTKVFESRQIGDRETGIGDIKKKRNKYNAIKGITKDNVKCNICNKTYSYKCWHWHMQNVHGIENIKCTKCECSFKSKMYLKRHMLYVHNGGIRCYNKQRPEETKSKFQCDDCSNEYETREKLRCHIRNCHGVTVKCDKCDSTFKSKNYLNSHIRRVHYDDGKKHKCKLCFKEFKSPRRVLIHLKNSHSSDKIKCSVCNRMIRKDNETHFAKHCRPKVKMEVDDEKKFKLELLCEGDCDAE